MKNIHILPTSQPSILHLYTDENGTRLETCELEYSHTRDTQHIYITNDEPIKEGDWTFDGENPYKWTKDDVEDCLYNLGSENYKGCKKIILTTDGDLIKDGVQAIDDEFLEWFVKNPSCEGVDQRLVWDEEKLTSLYKIIIPQEKPKQERMYSEEEVKEIIKLSCEEGMMIQRTINDKVKIPYTRIKDFTIKMLEQIKTKNIH